MKVNVFDFDTGAMVAQCVTLLDILPDDPEERAAVQAALDAKGFATVGGGAAPAFKIVRAIIDEIDDHDDEPDDRCTDPGGHSFVCSGTAYGGDDESYHGEGRSYCEFCGADGDA